MNPIMIPSSVMPNYNYLAAENSFLRQNVEYKDAVLCEQQSTIQKFQADVQQISSANMQIKQENDKLKHDAERWQTMKKILLTQGGERQLYEVQKFVDRERAK